MVSIIRILARSWHFLFFSCHFFILAFFFSSKKYFLEHLRTAFRPLPRRWFATHSSLRFALRQPALVSWEDNVTRRRSWVIGCTVDSSKQSSIIIRGWTSFRMTSVDATAQRNHGSLEKPSNSASRKRSYIQLLPEILFLYKWQTQARRYVMTLNAICGPQWRCWRYSVYSVVPNRAFSTWLSYLPWKFFLWLSGCTLCDPRAHTITRE